VTVLGRSTGHVGAGDVPANLTGILTGDELDVGDCALSVGSGAGITASALVVERVTATCRPTDRAVMTG
jgi:3-oxoacyl-[acyl-carrier-protein] synthase-3